MQFDKRVRKHDQTRRYSIATTDNGWEVREERGNAIVRKDRYQDWHRVERVRRIIVSELNALRETGWHDES
jgi:hypothetical protein